jgi:hypothetical protein
VRRVEGQIEEKGPRGLLLHVRRRALGERVGEVAVKRFQPGGSVEQGICLVAYGDVRVRATEKAEELLEASLKGMVFLADPEMPFAEDRCAVTSRLETVRDRCFLERQAELPMFRTQVEFVSEPLRVAACHHPGASRAAVGSTDVGVGESHPLAGEGINVGGTQVSRSMHAKVCVAHVVRDDDDDVRWTLRLRAGDGCQAGCGESEKYQLRSHSH